MNDDDVLGTVRDGMGGVRMLTPVQELVVAGRSRRRRRIGGVAAGAALATAATVALAIGNPQVNAPPVARGNAVHVHLAAFSVDTNSDGTVTVKLTKSESLDPEIMQRTLAEAGVPAQITINKWCSPTNPSQNLAADFEKVVLGNRSGNPGGHPQTDANEADKANKADKADKDAIRKDHGSDGRAMLIIKPSAMPPASKLVIGMRTGDHQPDSPSRVAVSMVLVPDDAPLTCSTDVPTAPPSDPKPKSTS